MLNFSETVCVLRSSSLPAREGALESSNGEAKGPLDMSELQLDRRDDMPEGDRNGDSSRYGRVLSLRGGRSISADSATAALLYIDGTVGDRMPGLCGAVVGRMGCVNERAEVVRAVLGRAEGRLLSSVRASCVPELRRMCGGPLPRGDCGASDDMVDMWINRCALLGRRRGGGVYGRLLWVNECCYRRRHAMGNSSKGSGDLTGQRVALQCGIPTVAPLR